MSSVIASKFLQLMIGPRLLWVHCNWRPRSKISKSPTQMWRKERPNSWELDRSRRHTKSWLVIDRDYHKTHGRTRCWKVNSQRKAKDAFRQKILLPLHRSPHIRRCHPRSGESNFSWLRSPSKWTSEKTHRMGTCMWWIPRNWFQKFVQVNHHIILFSKIFLRDIPI